MGPHAVAATSTVCPKILSWPLPNLISVGSLVVAASNGLMQAYILKLDVRSSDFWARLNELFELHLVLGVTKLRCVCWAWEEKDCHGHRRDLCSQKDRETDIWIWRYQSTFLSRVRRIAWDVERDCCSCESWDENSWRSVLVCILLFSYIYRYFRGFPWYSVHKEFVWSINKSGIILHRVSSYAYICM